MLYRKIINVYSQIHTKHINTPCWQNVEFCPVLYPVTTGNQRLTEALPIARRRAT